MHWIGIDVAKKTFDAALVFDGQHYPETKLHEVPVKTFVRTQQGVDQFLSWVDEQLPSTDNGQLFTVQAVMESTGKFSLELATWLFQHRKENMAAIVNPGLTSSFIKSMGLRNKTDRIEARALAFYGAERRPALYEPATPSQGQLRELCRLRDSLISERVACQNRGDEESPIAFIRRTAARRIRELERHITKVEEKMKQTIQKEASLKRDYEILNSIPGVSFVTASVVLAELGDLRRFTRARQISAFAGLSPKIHDSGTSVKGKRHLCKFGNSRIRHALYMATMSAVCYCPCMRKCYEDLLHAGKSKMSALGAVMRKLLVLMRAMLIANKPYDRNYQNSGMYCGKQHIACG